MKLSIVIPVFNEEKTLEKTIERVLAEKVSQVHEIIVIDDGSTDTSFRIMQKLAKKHSGVRILRHKKNQGKGAAVLTGITIAGGTHILIQDADLEYHPKHIHPLVQSVNGMNTVVYGTRLKRLPNMKEDGVHRFLLFHYFGNRFLSLVTSFLFGQWITDMETCYKLFPVESVKHMTIRSKGFAFEPEITAKLLKKGYKIKEVKIKTEPRGYAQGKKLNAIKEGPVALWTLLKYRFTD